MLLGMVLSLFGLNVGLYALSFDVSHMVGGSVFIIVLWSYAIWRTQKMKRR
jgi:hypothetical protein